MNNFNQTDALTHAISEPEQHNLLTAKKWLEKHRRYPLPHERGFKKGKGVYFSYQQTKRVYSEAKMFPLPDTKQIKDKYRGKQYYFDGECELKLTPNQWLKQGRRVKLNSVPCCGLRDGFNHKNKQNICMSFFLYSDTVPA